LASAADASITALGGIYERWVDYGEAYSHAAGITLNSPVLSHDLTALIALMNAGQTVPPCVLRLFDLLALTQHVGAMTSADCDTVRAALAAEREYVPKEFKNCSFDAGVPNFVVRIQDGTKPIVGAKSSAPPRSPFANVLVL
jgi:hypothetical protein